MLALVPAGFLVLMLLSALAVDSAVSYLAQQRLHDALSAAANDAVAAAVDNQAFYSSGSVSLDPATVAQVVCSSVGAQGDGGFHQLQVTVATTGVAIRLTGSATVDAVFGRAIPGFGRRSVHSSANATLAAAPAGGAPALFGPATPLQC